MAACQHITGNDDDDQYTKFMIRYDFFYFSLVFYQLYDVNPLHTINQTSVTPLKSFNSLTSSKMSKALLSFDALLS